MKIAYGSGFIDYDFDDRGAYDNIDKCVIIPNELLGSNGFIEHLVDYCSRNIAPQDASVTSTGFVGKNRKWVVAPMRLWAGGGREWCLELPDGTASQTMILALLEWNRD